MLYKVCNSFVEMGPANVQATDYLKGVGQYFPTLGQHSMSAFPPTQHWDRGGYSDGLVSYFSAMEKWDLGGACPGILVWDPEPWGVWGVSGVSSSTSYQASVLSAQLGEGLGQGSC